MPCSAIQLKWRSTVEYRLEENNWAGCPFGNTKSVSHRESSGRSETSGQASKSTVSGPGLSPGDQCDQVFSWEPSSGQLNQPW